MPVGGLPGGHPETTLYESKVEIQKKTPVNEVILMSSVLRIAGKFLPANREVADSLDLDRLCYQFLD